MAEVDSLRLINGFSLSRDDGFGSTGVLLVQPVVQRESTVAVSLDRLGLGTIIPQIVVLEAAGSSPVSHP